MADTPARRLDTVGHQKLLNPPKPTEGFSSLDAIIVPTARPTAQLGRAVELATAYDCPLLALCSRDASAKASIELGIDRSVHIVAIDTAQMDASVLPSFRTADVLDASPFRYDRDTSVKRNLALLLALGAGWDRVAFLDDDISVPDTSDLGRAASLLSENDAVGIRVENYPDNSVVCHANRATGGKQGKFIGSGALVVGPSAMSSFFPRIYNEDWFFLLDTHKLRPSTYTGLAIQDDYKPFDDEGRARMEEFGDSLAEGLFSLLESGKSIHDANEKYWRGYLKRRQRFIDTISARVPLGVSTDVDPWLLTRALAAAREVNEQIWPKLCEEYVQAWIEDRAIWRHRANEVRQARATTPMMDIFELIAKWGLADRSFSSQLIN
jgi:hypothetical protein